MNVNYSIIDCKLGKLLVSRTSKGICSVAFGDESSDLLQDLTKEFPKATITEDEKGLKTAIEMITDHLAGKMSKFDLPLDIHATAFQKQVWQTLVQIPHGSTVTYTDIAVNMGDRNKVRAVARACATNRIALLIPCHRVVALNGKLSGYRWGIERKQKLLDIESKKAAAFA